LNPDPEVPGRDIIVIGASAGGVQALCTVIEDLPADLPAAVFVVLHVAPDGYSALPAILSRSGRLPASHPADGEVIRPGRIYVAPPDRHLAIRNSHVHLSRNASENGHRPAVDVLFRTAARWYGPRVAGVVLTGNLDDGTAGLSAIKKCGGVAVVQDPGGADYPGMPTSAIANVDVDHVIPLAGIGALLDSLLYEPRPADGGICDEVEKEPDAMGISEDPEAKGSEPSGLTCPECGGALFEKPGERPLHFRCRTGHAYSPESLLSKQFHTLEGSLWAALRALEENAVLSRRLERRARDHGNLYSSARYEKRAAEAEKHAEVLRKILVEDRAIEEATAGVEG
jgi:two-component system, chemotaxis family, protein-glutamate methylesterase/glutaminase